MRKQILLSLCVVSALLLLGCSKQETNRNEALATTNTTEAAKPAATTPTTAYGTGEKIGVPECDDFIAKYDACVSSKVPEAARAQYQASIEQWRNSWRTLAANPQTKATLAQACKTTAEQARVSMKSFACDF
jgi:hypothetical protein